VSGSVVIVAHDVGGAGGMERQLAHMITGLLDAQWSVTVIARTCALERREGLRFVRVRAPRRPAALAFPMFFLAASVLAARRGPALLHTTGAIVANRADVSSVHYCHRAAVVAVEGSRASRATPLYRLNTAIQSRLSLAAEAWCYRPERTRRLCAVSEGVADELGRHFPRAAASVRTVANGVDSALFRPDRTARPEFRARLGIDDATPLALFAGGDWERKGLRHAVDALAHAPEWHLAVAGPGDPGELSARARRAGCAKRLTFLGRVTPMPPVFAAADAFVFPTAYEAFPLVALEAAASGLPLLATRVSGVEDLLEDGRNGWFVAPDGADIARRLNELAAARDVRQRMADEARRAAAGFSWEAMTASYLDVYSEL
jgi:glycosyltransferase involved in cell wall biosynthesis